MEQEVRHRGPYSPIISRSLIELYMIKKVFPQILGPTELHIDWGDL